MNWDSKALFLNVFELYTQIIGYFIHIFFINFEFEIMSFENMSYTIDLTKEDQSTKFDVFDV